ncbi:cadmium transporter [Paraburkholderia panacisoli]|uniref:Cadmium transporter n=1 Tax=Paraburkholderia panacisoli TaxID=2603818 RepID=A0A5B0HLA1_9BURK|nr:cadmium resistance transporter [Paraburkholderia panacisoli]KAA1015910.1 cadmium transporter [Paraburkholderia panacisoli]
MLSLVLLAIVAYAATNIDNLFVLLAFLARARGGRHRVIAGQCAGSLVLIAGSILFAALLMHLPSGYTGLLGLLPIGVGLSQAWERLGPGVAQRTKAASDEAHASTGAKKSRASAASTALSNAASSTRASSFLTVAGVAIANGSDNLAVYVPLYASHSPSENALISLVFVVMTGVWCAAAVWLVEHPLLGAPIRRYGTALLPLILLAIGVSVIARNDTLRLVFGI